MLTGQGVVQPAPVVATTFTGTIIGLGVSAQTSTGNLIPSLSQNNITTFNSTVTTPATFTGSTNNNWWTCTVSASSGPTAMVINGFTGAVATTTDGVTWTSRQALTPAASTTSTGWSTLAYGNGTWMTMFKTSNGTGSLGAVSTNDGASWTYINLPFAGNWSNLAYGNGRFVIMSSYSYPYETAYTVNNGASWTVGGISTKAGQGYDISKYRFIYSDTLDKFFYLISGSAENTIQVASTATGESWDDNTYTATGMVPATSIFCAWGNGRMVMIGAGLNYSWTSYDGVNWTSNSNPFSAYSTSIYFTSLAYMNNRFVASAKLFTGGYQPATWVSTDGVNWTKGSTVTTGVQNGGVLVNTTTPVTTPSAPDGSVYNFYGSINQYNLISSSRLTSYVSTVRSKWGTKSLNMTAASGFSGRANAVNVPLSATLSAPFTVESWVYIGAQYITPNFPTGTAFYLHGGTQVDFAATNTNSNTSSVRAYLTGGTTTSTVITDIGFDDNSNAHGQDFFGSGATALPVGAWYHVALSYHSTTQYSIWVNGNRGITSTTTAIGSLTTLILNSFGAADSNFYVDDTRVSNIDRYGNVASIAVPTGQFVSDAYTVALVTFE